MRVSGAVKSHSYALSAIALLSLWGLVLAPLWQ
jgi:hypothetical protein